MRVIGIDPGTLATGWGVVERHGTRLVHVAHGVLSLSGELCDRLVELDKRLDRIVAEHAPDAGAIESIFFSRNAQSAAKLGHARGVIMVSLRRAGLELAEYAPALVKRSIAGGGRADKNQMQRVVAALLRLPAPPVEDAADALAVAITHLHSARVQLARAKAGS